MNETNIETNTETKEESSNKFELVLCEIYNQDFHGDFRGFYKDTKKDDSEGHYIIIYTHNNNNVEEYSMYDSENDDEDNSTFNNEYWEMDNLIKCYRTTYRRMLAKHKLIRNYSKIIKKNNYIQPEIVKRITINVKINNNLFPVNLAIKKTFWIRIIQRVWKRVYLERCRILQMIEKNPHLLLKRQQNVKWTIRVPGIYGMLINL